MKGCVFLHVTGEYWIKFLKEEDCIPSASRFWVYFYEFLTSFRNAVIIIFIIFSFVARPVLVDGKSMLPTLQNNDWILLSEARGSVQRGEIIVILQPNKFDEQLIKRVVAVSGDKIDIDFDSGNVYLNDELLHEPYLNEKTLTGFDVDFPLTVEDGHVFVMGDNRNNSLDSRSSEIGLVENRFILGKAKFRIFPFSGKDIY